MLAVLQAIHVVYETRSNMSLLIFAVDDEASPYMSCGRRVRPADVARRGDAEETRNDTFHTS